MGAYLRWALIRGRALIIFSQFLASVVCLFCNRTVNGNNKTQRCNKARFLLNTPKKSESLRHSLIGTYSIFLGGRGKGGGRLFEFEKATTSALHMNIFSCWSNSIQSRLYVCAHHWESFVPAFLKVSIAHLFDNFESGKRNYCFRKSLEKILNFGSNQYKPWKERLSYNWEWRMIIAVNFPI